MTDAALAIVFAIFIWWFSTGLVLLLDNLPRGTFRWSLVLSSVLAGAALFGLARSAAQISPAAAYCAFTCALLVWGWHELSFLTGWITGPRKAASPAGISGWPRLQQAIAAILWHELGLLAAGALIIALTWGEPNQVGTWTFVVLWAMRASAKINLFLGVRNLSEEFLPPHLVYLQSFFRRRPINLLFPLSVTIATVVLTMLVMRSADSAIAPAEAVGLALVATMLALGILEHWLLVLPIPSTALWRWALRNRRDRSSPPDTGVVRVRLPAEPAFTTAQRPLRRPSPGDIHAIHR
jgi:putative photosynthetic complex assembly protein 2